MNTYAKQGEGGCRVVGGPSLGSVRSMLSTRAPGREPKNPTVTVSVFVNPFVSYYIHVSQPFSCNYALFCATARRYPLYAQELAHSFYRHGGVLVYPFRFDAKEARDTAAY
jgi:hypothetical protein